MSAKTITVFGATGVQGSSVVRSLQSNVAKAFNLRGITRNPSSDSAKALSRSGVEVTQADGWDKASLIAAFQGSWGAFVNTNSEDPVFLDPEEKRTEFDLGKIVVDAAIEAGVKVFVYSGFHSAKDITEGKIAVPAFDDKSAIFEYAKSTGKFQSVVNASPGWYFENFMIQDLGAIFGGFPFTPSEDGAYVFRVPRWGGKEDVPFIAISDDFGDIVHGIFLEPEKWNGKLVQGVSHIATYGEAVKAFTKVTGKNARFESIDNWEDLDVYGIPSLENLKLMFGFTQISGGRYYGDVTEADTAAILKKNAAEACGRSGEATKLLSLEIFFRRNFGRE
ncbi:NAD(P)-binding protein [Corynespora cassiicola Philippines]|uniref:NAD(P)-binding protein n=1 Tax=Corynespora cassiicola Philippines TaxID=1448308 RepID=A0A2T2P8P6_CORCC|nr:NAD(P)-binding protein [Corynespora cassiicola Philippines]